MRWRQRLRTLLAGGAVLACLAPAVGAETITRAEYRSPVERYAHFAAGRPHEYAQLVVITDGGRSLTLALAADEVFEDVAPRLVQLAPGEATEILAIVSQRARGARLVLIGLDGSQLRISAQSAAIGTPFRWLNPVGVADLDGDGRAEIAAVITPHLGGTLKVYRRSHDQLVEIAALAGFSNHAYGSPELGLSAPVSIAGRKHLLVPDTTRRSLRIMAFAEGNLIEKGRCALRAQVTGPLSVISATAIAVGLATGEQVINPNDCR